MRSKKQSFIKLALIYIFSLAIAIIVEKIVSILPFLSTQYFSIDRLLVIFLILSSATTLIIYRKFLIKNLHWAFIAIAVPIGFAMIIIFPRTTHVSQDDIVHFPAAYNFLLSEPNITHGTQMVIMHETSTTIGQGLSDRSVTYHKINKAHKVDIDSTTVANTEVQPYKTIVYLPFYLGFQLSAFLHLDLITGIAVAKACNFICYTILMFFAIYLSKSFKKVFFLFALFTTNIFYSVQFSYDPTITASIALAIAVFLRMMESRQTSPRFALIFTLSLTWGCLAKAIYCPLFCLVLLLPNSSFDTKKRVIAYKVCSMILMVVIAATFVLPMLSGGMAGDMRGGDTSVNGQLSAMFSSPLHTIGVFGLFLVQSFPTLIFGQNSGLGFGEPSEAAYIYSRYVLNLVFFIEAIYLIYTVVLTRSALKIHRIQYKIILALLYLAVSLAIIGALYLSFTPVGSTSIEGVQARYFLPILPLFLLLLVPSCQLSSSIKKERYSIVAIPYLCLVIILLTFTARITLM